MARNTGNVHQSDDVLIQVNHACNRFEQQWQDGLRPGVEEFLEGVAERDFEVLIRELLPLEIAYRQRVGSPLTAQECLDRFPHLDPQWLAGLLNTDASHSHELVEPQHDTDVRRLTEELGDRIGNYDLIEEIGEGGFGIVYRAEQRQPMRRLVALKVLKPGMDSKQILGRFEAERQALALMDHPNIARVYDAGTTENGRPYFVMELVRGLPITEYCDQCKLSVRERLKLFVTVCHAVQHAHQKGVIHRDIKPTNVLVSIPDGTPVPKVIDFGVAKAINQRLTEHTLRTGFAQMLGTPLYMSPEQAEMSVLDVDTRSDIYALGILLYVLLTGSTPIDKTRIESASFDEVRRLIREDDPPLPSARLTTIGAVQFSTVAEQRRMDPRRYIQLLRGDLDWIVMKALEKDRTRRYSSASALADDVTRHLDDLPVEACAPSWSYQIGKFAKRNRRFLEAVGTGLILLLMVAGMTVWQATKISRAQRDRETAERQTQAVADFLVETFRSPDPRLDGRNVTVAQLLDDAVKDLPRKFPSDSPNKASMLHAIGETYLGLGLPRQAIEVVGEAREIRERLLGEQHPETLRTAGVLAKAYQLAGRDKEAVAIAEDITSKGDASATSTIDEIEKVLTGAYYNTDRLDESMALRIEVYRSRRESLGPLHPETLDALTELGAGLRYVGRHAESLKLLEESVKLQKERLGVNHPDTLKSEFHLALSYFGSGAKQKGIQLQRDVLARRKESLGVEHPQTINSLHSLAMAFSELGQYQDAIRIYSDTLHQSNLSRTWRNAMRNNLANLYMTTDRLDMASEIWQSIVEDADESGKRERTRLIAMFNLASGFGMKRRWEDAAKIYEELLECEEDLTNDRATQAMSRLGTIYAWKNDIPSMERYGEETLGRIETPLNRIDAFRFSLPFLVMSHHHQSPTFEAVFAIAQETGQRYTRNETRVIQGIALLRLGDPAAAVRALRVATNSNSVFQRTIALCYLAIAQHRLGETASADASLTQATTLAVGLPGENDALSSEWHDQLLLRMAVREAQREFADGDQNAALESQQ